MNLPYAHSLPGEPQEANMSQTQDPFSPWFKSATGVPRHEWQYDLGNAAECRNRLIRIPTGLGKTLGVLAAWIYNRIERQDDTWPRRLVWCLPMRVLVEQTENEARRLLEKLHLLWDGKGDHTGKVGVHQLMGGEDAGDWHLYPEECAILIGTQDMLLSRALNRGYACPRARWPMEFGLLNQDALWVMDEVQLMDVGLATSAQLQQFREEDKSGRQSLRPCYTWWMSATLQPDWLNSVDTQVMVADLRQSQLTISADQRTGNLWEVEKSLTITTIADDAAIAELALKEHQILEDSAYGKISLVILNTVDRAVAVYSEIRKRRGADADTRLIHSRFRGHERAAWRKAFLCREACRPGVDRIIVATQVIEAGVDISASCLITELAPWPNLVQRFGRAARYGGQAKVVVVSRQLTEDKDALPYGQDELKDTLADACRKIQFQGVAQASLEDFEANLTADTRSKLYPYVPQYLLLRRELDELFDTTADLTGADLDISRFIRTGDECDCHVFWDVGDDDTPSATLQPSRLALCAVACYKVSKWLCNGDELKDGCRAFIFDYLTDAWRPLHATDIRPGQTILVHPDWGGYHPEKGFTGEKRGKKEGSVPPVPATLPLGKDTQADAGQDNDTLSQSGAFQTITQHARAVANEVAFLASTLSLPESLRQRLMQTGRFHDLGKAHPVFRHQIVAPGKEAVLDLAKAPKAAWTGPRTPGFRHELASALALFELLAATDQDHAALLGACAELITAGAVTPERAPLAPSAIGRELAAITATEFNLLVYLVASHHGKVRAALHACPADQDAGGDTIDSMPIRGIHENDLLPAFLLPTAAGAPEELLPALTLHLAPAQLGLSGRYGPSWRERTLALQAQYGPFTLAYLEALFRTADIRASRKVTL